MRLLRAQSVVPVSLSSGERLLQKDAGDGRLTSDSAVSSSSASLVAYISLKMPFFYVSGKETVPVESTSPTVV